MKKLAKVLLPVFVFLSFAPLPIYAGVSDSPVAGAFQTTATAKGLNITGNIIKLTAADATNPGSVSTGAQTFGGVKTFTSPILVTPNLGTPSALVLTNATGTPASLVLTNATGTPSSIGLANGTGLPISTGVSGLATNMATFLANGTSISLINAMTNETGNGSLVFSNAATMTSLAATVTTLNLPDTVAGQSLTIRNTQATTTQTATRTLAFDTVDANRVVTLGGNFTTVNNDVTLTTSGSTNVTLPTSGTLVNRTASETLTNKTLTAPVIATISNTGTLTLPTSTDTLVGRATTDTLTNKTLTTPIISTISNTGTLTLPTSTDTLVGRATTDTLTNKTLTTPVISGVSNASSASQGTVGYVVQASGAGVTLNTTGTVAVLTNQAAGDYLCTGGINYSGSAGNTFIRGCLRTGATTDCSGLTTGLDSFQGALNTAVGSVTIPAMHFTFSSATTIRLNGETSTSTSGAGVSGTITCTEIR